MDRSSVIHHLRAWADGVDPATGEALPAEHPAQRADTIRTLYAAILLLESDAAGSGGATGTAPQAVHPHNAGRPWTAEDDLALAKGFDAGTTVASLAAAMGRTRGAITARLVRLGKIEAPESLRLRGQVNAGTPEVVGRDAATDRSC